MVNIIEEMKQYEDSELRLLGLGIWTDLSQNTAIDHGKVGQLIKKAAILSVNQVFPFPVDEDAFQLTPQQIYLRARLVQEFVKLNRELYKGDKDNVQV